MTDSPIILALTPDDWVVADPATVPAGTLEIDCKAYRADGTLIDRDRQTQAPWRRRVNPDAARYRFTAKSAAAVGGKPRGKVLGNGEWPPTPEVSPGFAEQGESNTSGPAEPDIRVDVPTYPAIPQAASVTVGASFVRTVADLRAAATKPGTHRVDASLGGDHALAPGRYDFGAVQLKPDAPVTLRSADPSDPAVIAYAGPKGEGAIQPERGANGSRFVGLAFALAPRTLAFRLHAGRAEHDLIGCVVRSGGGLLASTGASGVRATECRAEARVDDNFVYASDGSGVTLTRCRVPFGSRFEQPYRFMGVSGLLLDDCEAWADRKCPLRIHHGDDCWVRGGRYVAVDTPDALTIGPMGGGDGGIKLPPGPDRDAKMAYRLTRFRVTAASDGRPAEFVGGLSVAPGLVKGLIEDATFDVRRNRLLAMTTQYGDRPAPSLTLRRVAVLDVDTPRIWYGDVRPFVTVEPTCTLNGRRLGPDGMLR